MSKMSEEARKAATRGAKVWRDLDEAQQMYLAAAVHIGLVVNTADNAPQVWFPLGDTGVILSAWRPDGLALSKAFRPFGLDFHDPSKTNKDGEPRKPKKGAPVVIPEACWYGPLGAVLAAVDSLAEDEEWTVKGSTDYTTAKAKAKQLVEDAPRILARVAVPGSSSRSAPAKDSPKVSPEALAEALAKHA